MKGVNTRREKYYRYRIRKAIKPLLSQLREGKMIVVRVRPTNFWCTDAGYHFDAFIYLLHDGRAYIFGTGFHCSWPSAVKVDSHDEAIKWLARWCASYNYKWGIDAYIDTDMFSI